MRQLKEEFDYAGKKAVRTEQVGSTWPVYKEFEVIEEEGKLYIYAPLRPPDRPEEAVIQIGRPDLNRDRVYSPLRDTDLFLKFAALMPSKPVSKEEWLGMMLDWAKSYGVLGSHAQQIGLVADNPKTLDYSEQNDRIQSSIEFGRALQEAYRCLRLYEAAYAHQDFYRDSQVDGELLADEDALADVLSEQNRKKKSLGQQRELALQKAQSIVHAHVSQQCYPILSRQLRQTSNNTYETSGYFQGWGCRSLLGAMYLQMMWLMTTASNVKRCEGPGCINIITFDPPESPASLEKGARGKYRTRSDKKYCSANCKSKWHYHNVIKPQRVKNQR